MSEEHPEDASQPKPEHLTMQVMDGILAALRHIVDTVPAASGIGPFLTQTQDRFAKLRDMVIPPPKPVEPAPEPEPVAHDHSDETKPGDQPEPENWKPEGEASGPQQAGSIPSMGGEVEGPQPDHVGEENPH